MRKLIHGIGWVDVPTKRGDVTPDPKNPPQLGPVTGAPVKAKPAIYPAPKNPPQLDPVQGQPMPAKPVQVQPAPPQPKNPPQLGPVQEQPMPVQPMPFEDPKNPQRLGPVDQGYYIGNDQNNMPYIAYLLKALTGG